VRRGARQIADCEWQQRPHSSGTRPSSFSNNQSRPFAQQVHCDIEHRVERSCRLAPLEHEEPFRFCGLGWSALEVRRVITLEPATPRSTVRHKLEDVPGTLSTR
jgi:hypothetical protein